MNVGSPAWENIPDWQSVLENALDPLAILIQNARVKQSTKPGPKRPAPTIIPVGRGIPAQVPVQQPQSEVLDLGQLITRTVNKIPPPTIGPTATQVRSPVSIPATPPYIPPGSPLGKPPIPVLTQVIAPPVIPKPIINSGVVPVALDLGGLLTQAIQTYGDIKTQPQPVLNPLGYLNDVFGSDPPGNSFAPPVGPSTGVPPGYKINCQGQLVKKTRRRRRRLATASDIKDLASLTAVTTPAEKKTWIATHPS